MKSSLVVVGSGIKFVSHLTQEAITYIKQSDKVLYLVNDPAMKKWIDSQNKNAESLDQIYFQYPLRKDCYKAITHYILENLKKELHLCVVLYGHPCVFAQPALDAVIEARSEGYKAFILPAISAEDCLFADLLIDPGTYGCQSFEATDFLIHRRKFDPSSHLILWQADYIGNLSHSPLHENSKGLSILSDYLKNYYDVSHEIVLYEAAQYPSFNPIINKILLTNLSQANLSAITTLYIPPGSSSLYDEQVMKQLNMDKIDLC